MKPILDLYAILCTDDFGTQLFSQNFRLQLFSKKENAEKKSCELTNNYNLVQVIPFKVISSETAYMDVDKL